MFVEPDPNLLVPLWGIIAAVALYRHWRGGWGVGLLLTYLVSFAVLHWVAPALHLLPWVETPGSLETAEGLRLSVFAIASFLVGLELTGLRKQAEAPPAAAVSPHVLGRIVTLYLTAGVLLYLLVPIASRLPSISAVVSTGSTLAAVGVALKCWHAWVTGHRIRMWLWMAAIVVFPLVTVVVQGFLGYGFLAALIVLSFVASLHRPSLITAVSGLMVFYGGLSIYVTYMRDRGEIREVVWGGETVERRVGQLQDTFANAEWFDPRDEQHLQRVNERLDQDYLIGSAKLYLQAGWVDFAKGGTLVAAAAAVVPRAIWPDKPVVAGSGDIVTTYTGLRFMYGTSVGVGQVMELYVNFGTGGVILGFIGIGMIIAFVDRRAGMHLRRGDVRSFALWYIPGLSVLQIGGTFGEVAATAAASLVLVMIVGLFTRASARNQVPLAVPQRVLPDQPEVRL